MKCRVFVRQDRSVIVSYFFPSAKREGESWEQFMDRATEKKLRYRDLPFFDMEESEVPSKKDEGKCLRCKWIGNIQGRRIEVDLSKECIHDKISVWREQLKAADPMVGMKAVIELEKIRFGVENP